MTRSHKRNLESLDNIVNDHLTDSDFSGTLRDLQGNSVPKPGGGYWNHLQEMKDSYTGLQKILNSLSNYLNNPNLSSEVRQILQEALNKAIDSINKIDDLFAPYGGIDKW